MKSDKIDATPKKFLLGISPIRKCKFVILDGNSVSGAVLHKIIIKLNKKLSMLIFTSA